MIIHLEKNNLNDLISNGLHLVDFYAEWCGPCKMMQKVFEEIENDIEGKLDIIKVDIDKFQKLSEEYRIMSVPTMMFYKDGVKIKEIVGFYDKEELLEIINNL